MRKLLVAAMAMLSLIGTGSVVAVAADGDGDVFTAAVKSPPANELLDERSYSDYVRMLDEFDCAKAAKTLSNALVKRHPKYSQLAFGKPDFTLWLRVFSAKRFPELSFCVARLRIRYADLLATENNQEFGKFIADPVGGRPADFEGAWKMRDHGLSDLATLAMREYRPAMLHLAEYLRERELVNNRGLVELFLLRRACMLGEPCARYQKRIDELHRALKPSDIASVERELQAENSQFLYETFTGPGVRKKVEDMLPKCMFSPKGCK